MLLLGDCLEVLRSFEENSVDSIVTDPPYGIAFMNKKWDYDIPTIEIWKECMRVLKPGGHALIACGTRTQHRMTVNIEDAGFEIRDVITWLYGSGFPKSLNIGKQGGPEGWGTALKPACEFWTLARKPLSESTVAKNVERWGCGGINIDGCRVEATAEENAELNRPNKRPGEGASGFMTSTSREFTPAQGRFPANLILDEQAGLMLDEQSGHLKSGQPGKRTKEWCGYATGLKKLEQESGFGDSGGASRFFYCAKASKSERGDDNNHPTVKPIKLMQYLIKLITPQNGVVLDPFMGSGSTGLAAKKLGFKFIGIEKDADYYEIAKKRIPLEDT